MRAVSGARTNVTIRGVPAAALAINQHFGGFMIRKLIVLLCLTLAVTAWGFAAQPSAVSIMTQNMDAGTDLTFAIGELLGFFPPGVGVELTYEEILATDIPQRTALLAATVASKKQKPDLLALQEVTLWRTGASVDTATTVLFDQLQLLLADLAAAFPTISWP
jgi:hypothetical protein